MKAKSVGCWIEILSITIVIACVLALGLATLGAAVGTAIAEPESTIQVAEKPAPTSPGQAEVFEGIVTDSKCGAKHSTKVGMSAADCTRACVHGGERFALVAGETIYFLEGEAQAVKHVAGERARISGTLNGDTISVASVNPPES
jgi:F0F1-type ATP synthase membrane subunit c/vacuolar-type H+-ATPase subunit K